MCTTCIYLGVFDFIRWWRGGTAHMWGSVDNMGVSSLSTM